MEAIFKAEFLANKVLAEQLQQDYLGYISSSQPSLTLTIRNCIKLYSTDPASYPLGNLVIQQLILQLTYIFEKLAKQH